MGPSASTRVAHHAADPAHALLTLSSLQASVGSPESLLIPIPGEIERDLQKEISGTDCSLQLRQLVPRL